MNKTFHFIAGLPRSGSTLLAAILRQNPNVYARMSSPLARILSSILVETNGEDGPLVTPERRRRILRGVFDSFYADEERGIIFDTNRGWCARLPLLHELFDDVRVICLVRSVAGVLDSFETLVQRNVFERSGLFHNEEERATVYSRSQALLLPNRTVGYALNALKEAVYGNYSRALLLVEYDHLTRFPKDTLRLIYEFLGASPFEHSFDSLTYDEPHFDNGLSTPGLHFVKRNTEAVARPTVLPPDLFEHTEYLNFWREPNYSEANIIRLDPADNRLAIQPLGGTATPNRLNTGLVHS